MNPYVLWTPFIGVCLICLYVVLYGLCDLARQKKRLRVKEAVASVSGEAFAFFGGKKFVAFAIEDAGDSQERKFIVEYCDGKLSLQFGGAVVQATEYEIAVLNNSIRIYYDSGVRVLITPLPGAADARLIANY